MFISLILWISFQLTKYNMKTKKRKKKKKPGKQGEENEEESKVFFTLHNKIKSV